MAYLYEACAVRVTIYSFGDKFWPVSNFTKFHHLIQAAYLMVINH